MKIKPPKIRKRWSINPATRVEKDRRRYNRKRAKKELRHLRGKVKEVIENT